MSRKERGLTQSLFLVETFPFGDNPYKRKYAVMGTTGNVYHVVIQESPECTCPDFIQRQKKCKHIYFILLKVMKIEKQRGNFSKKELEEMFSNIPTITSNLIVNSDIRNKYYKALDKVEQEEDGTVKRQPVNDICPICLDSLEDGNEIDFCKWGCGKPIHKKCFSMWSKKNQKTCVFCRKEWDGDKANTSSDSGYINLLGKEGEKIKRKNDRLYIKNYKKYRKNYLNYDLYNMGEDSEDFEDDGDYFDPDNSFISNENSSIDYFYSHSSFLNTSKISKMTASYTDSKISDKMNNNIDLNENNKKTAFQIFCQQNEDKISKENKLKGNKLKKKLQKIYEDLDEEEKSSLLLIAKISSEQTEDTKEDLKFTKFQPPPGLDPMSAIGWLNNNDKKEKVRKIKKDCKSSDESGENFNIAISKKVTANKKSKAQIEEENNYKTNLKKKEQNKKTKKQKTRNKSQARNNKKSKKI